jgi:hypothetical protein
LSDIFEKFSTLNTSMQGKRNRSDQQSEYIYREVRLVGQKTRREKFGHVLSFEDFVEENSVESSDTGIHQCIKNHLVNLQSRFYKYFQKFFLLLLPLWNSPLN